MATEKARKKVFYVVRNSGDAVFCKTGKFFVSQGGLRLPWGKNWKRVLATSDEEARTMI